MVISELVCLVFGDWCFLFGDFRNHVSKMYTPCVQLLIDCTVCKSALGRRAFACIIMSINGKTWTRLAARAVHFLDVNLGHLRCDLRCASSMRGAWQA